MPKGIKKEPAERLICIAGQHAGLSLAEINTLLAQAGFGNMDSNSYEISKNTYLSKIMGTSDTNETLKAHIFGPKVMADL